VFVRGGVLPRCPARRVDSWGVVCSAPRTDTEVSEEDRSTWTGLRENSLLNAEPTLEDRFVGL
jgi:hypothetical protein